ncbi:MAG: hypothetical protein AABX39_05135 [Nanoarchaeota archaeon]
MGDGKATFLGFVGGSFTVFSAISSLEYVAQKSMLLQYHINKAPELTDAVLKTANESANKGSLQSYLFMALFSGAMAGVYFVSAYQESQKDKK